MTRQDTAAFERFVAANMNSPEYAGRSVVFVHGILQAVGDSERELVMMMHKQFGNVPMHVGKVSAYRRIEMVESPELVQTQGALDRESLVTQLRVIAAYMIKNGGSSKSSDNAPATAIAKAANTLQVDPIAGMWFQDSGQAPPEPHRLPALPCHMCGKDARRGGCKPVWEHAGYVCALCFARNVAGGEKPRHKEGKA